MTVQRRSNNIPHTLCICTTLAFLIYCLSLLLKLELWQLDQVCAKFVKGILFFLQLWIIDRQQLGKDSIMKMDEVQKFAGISPFCYSNVLAWFIWLLFCRKNIYMKMFSDTIQHGTSWEGLKLMVTYSNQALAMGVQKLSTTITLSASFFIIHEFWTSSPS